LSESERVTLYQTSWWFRLYESIADDYAALVKCIGAVKFKNLIKAYLKAYPPNSYTLVYAADCLPEFLEYSIDPPGKDPAAQNLVKNDPWLIDLAKAERAYYRSTHAADPVAWDPNWLTQLNSETASKLRLRTQPSVSLIKSDWNIAKVLEKEKTCPAGPCHLVIYRKGFRPTHRELAPLQYQLLQLASTEATLNDWAECAGDSTEWVTWLGEWTQQQIIYPDL
jgi:hypothetical protein